MSSYLQYLIWMMLFVIVIEMIFPDSSYRKYIKLVLGCILIYTMLKPIASFVQVDGADYEDYVKKYQILLSGEDREGKSYEDELNRQQQTLQEVYEISMKDYIEQEVEVRVAWIQISWNEDEMENIELIVEKPSEALKIGEIHIGDKSNTIDGSEEELKNKIKTSLSNFYNVQVCNIHITVQKN